MGATEEQNSGFIPIDREGDCHHKGGAKKGSSRDPWTSQKSTSVTEISLVEEKRGFQEKEFTRVRRRVGSRMEQGTRMKRRCRRKYGSRSSALENVAKKDRKKKTHGGVGADRVHGITRNEKGTVAFTKGGGPGEREGGLTGVGGGRNITGCLGGNGQPGRAPSRWNQQGWARKTFSKEGEQDLGEDWTRTQEKRPLIALTRWAKRRKAALNRISTPHRRKEGGCKNLGAKGTGGPGEDRKAGARLSEQKS